MTYFRLNNHGLSKVQGITYSSAAAFFGQTKKVKIFEAYVNPVAKINYTVQNNDFQG